MKTKITQIKSWLYDRVGFHRKPGFDDLHASMRRFSAIFFEFLKRLALLSVLFAAARNNPWLEFLYFAGLIALIIPIGSWLEQWDFDFRTRNPKHYRPDLGEEMPPQIPIPADQPSARAHSWLPSLLWNAAIFFAVNIGIRSFVETVASELSNIK